jgi:cytochrome c oxidase subunit 1
MNGIFFPMFIQGLAGISRRLYDGGASYTLAQDFLYLNKVMSFSAGALAVAQIPFIFNFFVSFWKGKKAENNHWQSTTLEWSATTSPPLGHGNFEVIPTIFNHQKYTS